MDNLEEIRAEIASVDAEMARLFEKRFGLCGRVAAFKKTSALPVRVPEQESKVVSSNSDHIGDPLIRDYYIQFLKNEIALSCAYQKRILGEDIIVGRGVLSEVGDLSGLRGRVLVVTDSGVPSRYVSAVAASFRDSRVFTMPAGEGGKTPETLSSIIGLLSRESFTREDAIVAVGGGVVGDVAGFAASCYMRGIAWYDVPTTLLAMVDSSVGGKTAVNFGGIKNLVGAFHQPSGVFVDPDVLETLSPRLFSEGVAEMIKMAATSSRELYDALLNYNGGPAGMGELINKSLDIKLSVVRKDPCEEGLRRVLNFGHTLGHAIESASGGTLYHGECVAIGMLYMCSDSAAADIRRLLDKYNLPHADDFTAEELCGLVRHDKKRSQDGITVVRVDEIGSFEFRNLTMGQLCGLVRSYKKKVLECK